MIGAAGGRAVVDERGGRLGAIPAFRLSWHHLVMAKLKTIYRQDTREVYGYEFTCPGCEAFHVARNLPPQIESVRLKAGHLVGTSWKFNGNMERPTFEPSVLHHGIKRQDGSIYSPRCHSFVTDGRIQFLPDCEHPLAGQTVELPEVAE